MTCDDAGLSGIERPPLELAGQVSNSLGAPYSRGGIIDYDGAGGWTLGMTFAEYAHHRDAGEKWCSKCGWQDEELFAGDTRECKTCHRQRTVKARTVRTAGEDVVTYRAAKRGWQEKRAHRECRTCKASRPYMDFYVGAKGNPCLDECRACVWARCEVFKAEYLREHGTPYVRKKERDAVRAVGVG